MVSHQAEKIIETDNQDDVYLDVNLEVGVQFEVIFEDKYLPLKMFGVDLKKGDFIVVNRILGGNQDPENPKIYYSVKRGEETILAESELEKKLFQYLYLRKIPNIGNRPEGKWAKIPREFILKKVFQIIK